MQIISLICTRWKGTGDTLGFYCSPYGRQDHITQYLFTSSSNFKVLRIQKTLWIVKTYSLHITLWRAVTVNHYDKVRNHFVIYHKLMFLCTESSAASIKTNFYCPDIKLHCAEDYLNYFRNASVPDKNNCTLGECLTTAQIL